MKSTRKILRSRRMENRLAPKMGSKDQMIIKMASILEKIIEYGCCDDYHDIKLGLSNLIWEARKLVKGKTT